MNRTIAHPEGKADHRDRDWMVSKLEKKGPRRANILIIDDDVDAALQMDSVFAHLGCETTFSTSWVEAKKKLCALKPDIVILDWILDQHIDAGNVVEHCVHTFAKFTDESGHRAAHKAKIITYSSLSEEEITLLKNPYFDHIDHWQKPFTQRELLSRALGLLKKIGR